MLKNTEVLTQLKGGLIVSCQALPDEPLHSSFIMSRMAHAANLGGARGIRANTVEDITEIRKVVDLPVIGIIKKVYDDQPKVYITPTIAEVDALVSCGVEIIAVDATKRIHPCNVNTSDFLKAIRQKYPDQLFMADCSSLEEGVQAADIGIDLIGTTLCGYTDYTIDTPLPAMDMLKALIQEINKPVIAEGGIWTPEQLKNVMLLGVHAAVVGTAITRPMDITKRFVSAIK